MTKGTKDSPVTFEGKWKYQSYRPDHVSLGTEETVPTFVRWSPTGVVNINEGGTKGQLEFPGAPIKLDLKCKVVAGTPTKVFITAVMKLPGGKQFTNELAGVFVPAKLGQDISAVNPLVVRGTIVQTSDDIAPANKQPKFTTGYFVLEPTK